MRVYADESGAVVAVRSEATRRARGDADAPTWLDIDEEANEALCRWALPAAMGDFRLEDGALMRGGVAVPVRAAAAHATTARGVAGLRVASMSAAQRDRLLVAVLHHLGALDADGVVRPMADWRRS